MSERLFASARQFLQQVSIDGWVIKDFRYNNPVFSQILETRVEHLTRPVWLIITADAQALLVTHEVDAGRFSQSGVTHVDLAIYRNRSELLANLRRALLNCKQVAMEYSPLGQLPMISRVDAGSVELIKSFGTEVVSSGNLLQYVLARWSDAQLTTHKFAAKALTDIVREAFDFVSANVRWQLTEHDLAEFIRGRLQRNGLTYDSGPCVAFNEHSADPHYSPLPNEASIIRRNGWLLIDLWAKQQGPEVGPNAPVYSDITWVASLGGAANPQQQNLFKAVKASRDAAFNLISTNWAQGRNTKGYEVDLHARQVIEKHGYGSYFFHRLGHSLGLEVHSSAANLDSWETHDERTLLEGIGFTIEPGVYFPDFGVRLEMDVYMGSAGPEITTPPQEEVYIIDTE